MKKERTGEPQIPDIVLDADVRMRELYFDRAPDPGVRFRGNTGRNSVWESRRENLPDEVQEGVVYRNVGVRLRIASEVVDSSDEVTDSDTGKTNADTERVKTDLTKTDLKDPERAAEQQTIEGKEEKK